LKVATMSRLKPRLWQLLNEERIEASNYKSLYLQKVQKNFHFGCQMITVHKYKYSSVFLMTFLKGKPLKSLTCVFIQQKLSGDLLCQKPSRQFHGPDW
jgi:hypothetical protein